MISAHITGIRKAQAYLLAKKVVVKKQEQVGLNKAALFLQGEVKQSIAGHRNEPTSVDTGRFLNSVDTSVGKDDAIVFTNLPYAPPLEFGTTRIKARKHFRNSKDRNKQKMVEIMQREISI